MEWDEKNESEAQQQRVCVCVCGFSGGGGGGKKGTEKKKKGKREREEYNKSGETMSELHVVHLGSQPTEIAGQGPGLLG